MSSGGRVNRGRHQGVVTSALSGEDKCGQSTRGSRDRIKMWSRKAIATLDRFFPPCGPCAICGHKDARHRREFDPIIERFAAGETMKAIAVDREVPLAGVKAVLRIRPYRRGGHL